MKHIKKGISYTLLGTFGLGVMAALSGCENTQTEQQAQQANFENKFIVFQERENGKYDIVEEHPTSGPTRAIVKGLDGSERFMSEEELKALAQAEYDKMQAGNSELNAAPSGDTGLGLGGAILAGAAGALLGNVIGNALMNNKSFNQHRQTSNKSANARSFNSKPKAGTQKSTKSFFGNKSSTKSSSSSKSFFGG